jgi:hypothetical protein
MTSEAGTAALRSLARTRRQLSRRFQRLSSTGSQASLAREKADERLRFDELSGEFAERYARVRGLVEAAWVEPYWTEIGATLERQLLPRPPFGFLGLGAVMETMCLVPGSRSLRGKLRELEATFPETDLAALEEEYVGEPAIAFRGRRASGNSVHQLYHLARYQQVTGIRPRDLGSVVEWGGGYGSLARIFRKLRGGRLTYTIVDLPLSSCLQWLYLGSIFGRDAVHLLERPADRVVEGAINLVPAGLARPELVRGDLFVSTWALSESTVAAQETVVREWRSFGAERLLVAYSSPSQALPDAGWIEGPLREAGAAVEPMAHPRGSFYAFR